MWSRGTNQAFIHLLKFLPLQKAADPAEAAAVEVEEPALVLQILTVIASHHGLRLLLGIWGYFHSLGCASLSPFHPDPVLQDTLVCFLSDPLIPEPDILVASTLNVSQGSESDFKKWGQRGIFCD